MNREEFERLVIPFVDGELSESDRRAVEEHLETSKEARKAVAFEREFGERLGAGLRETADGATHDRILSRFREAAAAPPAATVDTARPAGRRLRFPMTPYLVPAAAAAIIAMLWFGGVFDDGPRPHGHDHTKPLDFVLKDGDDLFREVGIEAHEARLDRSRLRARLDRDTEAYAKMWPEVDGPTQAERFDATEVLMDMAFAQKKKRLAPFGDHLELVAFRMPTLQMNDGAIRVPQLILDSKLGVLSCYIFKGDHEKALFKTLHESEDDEPVLHECRSCSLIVRRFDDYVLVFISRMRYTDLRAIVRKI